MDFKINEEAIAVDMQSDRFLTFSIADVMFGIEMRYITEIIGMQQSTELPDTPDYMIGIINLRGKIIPVIDVRRLFGKEVRVFDDRTCIIVVDIEGLPLGLIVDRVSEVVTISASDVSSVPKAGRSQNARFVKNIGKTEKGVVLIVDCEKLMSDQDVELISELI